MRAVLRLLIDTLRGDPLIKQEERTDVAMQAIAECQGDINEARVMVQFYTDLAKETDPYKQWWLFARRRQKLEDNELTLQANIDNLSKLYAQLDNIRSKAP